jgi:glutamyl/glutaminyl-tRNA synthetase
VMSRAELTEAFTPERILKKSSVFDLDKLAWLNGRHLAETPSDQLLRGVRDRLEGAPGADGELLSDDAWLSTLVDLVKVRARTVDDMADQARPFVCEPLAYDDQAVAKHWAKDPAETRARLEAVASLLREAEWTETALESGLRDLAEGMGVGAGKLIHPLRVALTGQMTSPGIFEVLVLLGRSRALARVEQSLERVRAL